MHENEIERYSPEVSEEWSERFREGFKEFADNLELFLDEDRPALPVDPSSLDMGDERTFEELDQKEQEAVLKLTLVSLEVDLHDSDQYVRQYWADPSIEPKVSGKILIRVFKTNRTESEGTYLHEMNYQDQGVRYSIGRDEDI